MSDTSDSDDHGQSYYRSWGASRSLPGLERKHMIDKAVCENVSETDSGNVDYDSESKTVQRDNTRSSLATEDEGIDVGLNHKQDEYGIDS